jgi:hypothetical protein
MLVELSPPAAALLLVLLAALLLLRFLRLHCLVRSGST